MVMGGDMAGGRNCFREFFGLLPVFGGVWSGSFERIPLFFRLYFFLIDSWHSLTKYERIVKANISAREKGCGHVGLREEM